MIYFYHSGVFQSFLKKPSAFIAPVSKLSPVKFENSGNPLISIRENIYSPVKFLEKHWND